MSMAGAAAPVTVLFASPRQLPKPGRVGSAVVVLDIAFASEAGGQSFATVTLPFIHALGSRLRGWIDHHDSVHHADYADDPRFVLARKSEHGACPEMITPELVTRIGQCDTIVCHGDFDGLASAAKWLRGGVEPWPGCDDDARAIDTRIGQPGPLATRIDRAIRAAGRDRALLQTIVEFLQHGAEDRVLLQQIDAAGALLLPLELNAREFARGYEQVAPGLAWVDVGDRAAGERYDKTLLLLLGQQLAPIALVLDGDSASFAAAFDSGINFLERFGLSGGMPTLVSIQRARLAAALRSLGVAEGDTARIALDSTKSAASRPL